MAKDSLDASQRHILSNELEGGACPHELTCGADSRSKEDKMSNGRELVKNVKLGSAPTAAFTGLEDFRKEMNRMLDHVFHRDPFAHFGLPGRLKGFDLSPTVDVAERADCYEVTVELPGLSEKDVKVSLDGDLLTISGEKKAETTSDIKNVHLSERHYGSFQRQFSLPEDADSEKTIGEFKNGVLKVTIGRSKKMKESARQIDVKTT